MRERRILFGLLPPGRWRDGRSGSRGWIPFSIVVLLSAVAIAAAPAQGGPPPGVRTSLVADSSELTVGDLVTISLIVSHPAESTVVIPRLERDWGSFEVQAQTSVQTVSVADGIRTVAKQFRVTLFAPGIFETPDLAVSVRGGDGTVAQVSPVPIRLTVNSVLASQDEELKDLRPPADLSTPFWEQTIVLVLVAAVVLTTAGGTAFFLIRRSRRADQPAAAMPDLLTPWEVATQELERIARLDLLGRGDVKGHYTLVSAALRTYLGATYLRDTGGRNVDDMSTEEIESVISRSALDHGDARLVIELLQEADLVKFANYEPTSARANEAVVQVQSIIEATRAPVSTAPAAAPAVRGAAP